MKRFLSAVLAIVLMIVLGTTAAYVDGSGGGTFAFGKKEQVEVNGLTYSYSVTLPEGYDAADESRHYPVIFVMPDNGISGVNTAVADQLGQELSGGNMVDAIVVEPEFYDLSAKEGAVVYEAVAEMIKVVDADYKTIPEPQYRAVVGTETGGYLAAILTYTDGNQGMVSAPTLFGMMASVNGDFSSDSNIWTNTYGNFLDLLKSFSNYSADITNQFYTYMDAASEEERSAKAGETNEIISHMIEKGAGSFVPDYGFNVYYGGGSDVLDLTIKNGAADEAFLRASVSEAMHGIGNKLIQGMVTGELSLTPQAVEKDADQIQAVYQLQVNDSYAKYCQDVEHDLTLTIQMTDESGNPVHDDVVQTFPVKTGAYNNAAQAIALPNIIDGLSTQVTLSVNVLGKEMVMDSKPAVRIAETGCEPEDQLVDLMGGWKFKAFPQKPEVGVIPDAASAKDWEEVYPCLGWWDENHSKETNMKSFVGYAWYVKEFEIPEDFPEGNYVVPVGFFDETDVCYINGTLIGNTGLDADTWGNPEDRWDTERIYSVSSDVLNIGGSNVMQVLTFNKSGDGGWYSGHPGIYAQAAYNKLKDQPSVFASENMKDVVLEAVQAQISALEAKDLTAFASLVDPEYFQSGLTKAMLFDEVKELIDGDHDVQVTDTNQYVFEANGLYCYQAVRSMTRADGSKETADIAEYYKVKDDTAYLFGEHDRFFTQSMESAFKASASGAAEETLPESFMVYLPEGYFDPENADRRYPSAYLFHQFNSSSHSYAIDGVNEILDQAGEQDGVRDCIIVIPDSSGDSWWAGDWMKMVTDEVLPFVDSHYRTIQDARYRFTMGCSMGGAGACNAALMHPNLFSGMISFYGAIDWGGSLEIALTSGDEYLKYFTPYFVCGNRDLYKFGIPAIQLDQKLREANVPHFFELGEGGHDSAFYLPYFLDAFRYQTEKMEVVTEDEAKKVIGGTVDHMEVKDGTASVEAVIDVTDEITKYLHTVPQSAFTVETNPKLILPVTMTVMEEEIVVDVLTTYLDVDQAGSVLVSFETVSDDITQNAEILISAGLLDAVISIP